MPGISLVPVGDDAAGITLDDHHWIRRGNARTGHTSERDRENGQNDADDLPFHSRP